MTPPPVFSYLRGHHRRTGSTPTSPQAPQSAKPSSPPWSYDPARIPPPYRFSAAPSPSSASPISPLPPTLPSIRRVSSKRAQEQEPPSPQIDEGEVTESPATANSDLEKPVFNLDIDTSEPAMAQQYANGHVDNPQLQRDPYASSNNRPFAHQRYYRSDGSVIHSNHRGRNDHQAAALNPRAPSPSSSSFSSFQKSVASSTHLPSEPSTTSSRAHQQAPIVPAQKASKSKINLLNPVSLLMRRRASQNPTVAQDETPVSHKNLNVPALNLPKDYDPRIRGKRVHDFSAPRPKPASDPASIPDPIVAIPESKEAIKDISNASRRSPEKERTPIFTEHFEEDGNGDVNDLDAVRRESLANPLFIARMSRQLDFESAPETNAKTDNSENQPSTPQTAKGGAERSSRGTEATSYRHSSDQSTARSSVSNDTRATSPPQSPTKESPSRSSLSGIDQSFQPAGLPTHLSSTASRASRSSRFSFQLNSDRSIAQEKALEEKHKQKSMGNNVKPESVAESRYEDSDFDDDILDMDDMEEDAFEERIPGVNAEDDEYFGQDSFASTGLVDSMESNGEITSHDSSQITHDTPLAPNLPFEPFHSEEGATWPNGPVRENTTASLISDDMYFDDGVIGEPTSSVAQEFDESVFDSPVRSTFDQGRVNDEHAPQIDRINQWSVRKNSDLESNGSFGTYNGHRSDSGSQPGNDVAEARIAYQAPPQRPHRISIPSREIDKYHSALASAAIEAEAAGKFHRKSSIDSETSPPEKDPLSVPETAIDFQGEDHLFDMQASDDYELDDLDDDTMVAEANAEALAADDSGFYGREFGFYGSSSGNVEMHNGGFFDSDGLVRSMSGHNASREPNLTPITERSEFSTRNSFISLTALGGPPGAPGIPMRPPSRDQAIPNPGLKELASRIGLEDEELSLGQLLKLRKETFGGSTGSLGSFGGGGGSAASSPSTSFSSPLAMGTYHHPVLPPGTEIVEEHPFEEEEEEPSIAVEESSVYNSPAQSTLPPNDSHFGTGQFQSNESTPRAPSTNSRSFQAQQHQFTPPSQILSKDLSVPTTALRNTGPSSLDPTNSVPMPSASMVQKFSTRPPASSETFGHRQKPRHHRNSHGGSDSVTYVQEPDEHGEIRWYVERRRTMLSGEVVVVGRDLVEGGTI